MSRGDLGSEMGEHQDLKGEVGDADEGGNTKDYSIGKETEAKEEGVEPAAEN